jgi:NTP pyrophosphatase (non-canonical NTP hydrolase)
MPAKTFRLTFPCVRYPHYGGDVDKESVFEELRAFVAERNWSQFHTPENLAKSISIEAAELLECFQWSSDGERERVIEELADVLTYCLMLADTLGVDPLAIVSEKLAETALKYPVDKAKGSSAKYDQL